MSWILRVAPLSAGQTLFLSEASPPLQGLTSLLFILALPSQCASQPPLSTANGHISPWENSENLNTGRQTLLAADASAAEPERRKAKQQQEAVNFAKADPPTSPSLFNKHALFPSVLLNHCKQPAVAMHHFPLNNGSLIALRHKASSEVF